MRISLCRSLQYCTSLDAGLYFLLWRSPLFFFVSFPPLFANQIAPLHSVTVRVLFRLPLYKTIASLGSHTIVQLLVFGVVGDKVACALPTSSPASLPIAPSRPHCNLRKSTQQKLYLVNIAVFFACPSDGEPRVFHGVLDT